MKPNNEWTEYSSDTETVFATDQNGRIYKVAEWKLVSDTKMQYIAYNRDGSINRQSTHAEKNIIDIWNKYHTKESR